MSEELIQRNLVASPSRMGSWDYYNIGSTTLKALKAAKIIPDKHYAEFEEKKPDALIVNKPVVVAAIEYKQPRHLKTKKQIETAIQQELGTAKALNAKIYIVTDGKKTFWINPLTGNLILSDSGEPIATVFHENSEECVKLIHRMLSSINKDNDTLLAPPVVDPLPLARQIWQDLWAVSGATPENCLYTFVEVFIFKYLSDLRVLQGLYSFGHLLSQYKSNSELDVLEYYAKTVRPEIKKRFPYNPKDNTTIINGTIFVSKDDSAVGGYSTVFKKILGRFQEFGTLENIDYDFKSRLFETFLKESISKKNWGQFFTPLKVVRSIVSMADVRLNMSICDPACGVGKFLLEAISHDPSRYCKIEGGKLVPQITLSGFDKGFDRDEQKTIILAKANMLIYLSDLIRDNPGITVDFANLFNETFLLQTNSILGTLARPTENAYDLILTNPPYVMSGSGNLKDEIAKQDSLKRYFSVSAMGVEGLFMEWIIRALKPGGKAFVVVPDGIMNRSNDKRLRDFILEECDIDAVISLPINTFFTTNKKTYILAVTKKVSVMRDGIAEKERQTTPVFTYFCSEIGETRDVYRFDMQQNDLAEAAGLFNMFKGARRYFKTDDKRCKVVNIDAFYAGTHWSVERWWTQEERIKLGIKEEIESVTIEGFISIVEDTATTLTDFQESLRELAKKKHRHGSADLTVSEIFDLSVTTNGSWFTKTFINSHAGDIPVYGASKNEKDTGYGHIQDNIQGVKYFSNCLTWNIDGSFGLFLRKSRFSLSEKVIPLVLNDKYSEKLSLEFLRVAITVEAMKNPFSFTNKGGKTRLGNVLIKVPISENGDFDLDAQETIAARFQLVEQLKDEIRKQREYIRSVPVDVNLRDYSMVYKPLSEVLDPIKGKSVYTRKYGETHKGDNPVFSASSASPLTHIDTYDYDGNYLSWATNGFAGTVIVLNGRFSINGDRGLLIPKIDKVDILYLRYILEPLFRKLAKGRKGDSGEDEFTKLYPSMIATVDIPLPVDGNGNISLVAQNEIATVYDRVKQYRREVLDKLDVLLNQRVEY